MNTDKDNNYQKWHSKKKKLISTLNFNLNP